MTTFIYALKELSPGEFFSTKIRYIGKADDPYGRFEEHCRTVEKNHRGNWIRSLPSKGLSPQLEILDEVPYLEWEFWEREYIRLFRMLGFSLVNGTDGGDAPPIGSMTGRKHSKATRAKLSAARLGKPSPMTGKKHSEAARAKIGAAHSGNKYRLGKNHSEATRLKISNSAKQKLTERNSMGRFISGK